MFSESSTATTTAYNKGNICLATTESAHNELGEIGLSRGRSLHLHNAVAMSTIEEQNKQHQVPSTQSQPSSDHQWLTQPGALGRSEDPA